MKPIKLLFVLLFVGSFNLAKAQSPEQQIRLQELAAQLKQKSQAEKAEAVRVANEKGWPVRTEDENGRITELMRLDENGAPMYYTTFNAGGAALINSDELYIGGAAGLSLSGNGQTLGIWDGGAVRLTHDEFTGRAVQTDGATALSSHATHVAGTMIASGVDTDAKGMSYAASLSAHDWNNDASEMATAAAAGIKVSQHSYGYITGWDYGDHSGVEGWYWFGNTSDPTETEAIGFGLYNANTKDWDQIAYDAPNYLIVKSAGNDRNDDPGAQPIAHYVWTGGSSFVLDNTTIREADGGIDGYNSIPYRGNAKNIMTVGAVDVSSNMSAFSGWGPTDDGRIKPDIVAKGVGVKSSVATGNSNYDTYNGTSMSGPMVSGSIGLLLEHQENLHTGVALRSATMKGLILHTATDLGNAGPDYSFGWGLMNTQAAAEVMSANASSPIHIYESSLSDGATYSLDIKATGGEPLKATLVWTDVPGTPVNPESLNDATPMLVNDLDMRITDAGGTINSPYVLDPTNPANVATTGDNFRDNIEVINIATPVEGAIYTLTINHKGTLSSPQNYSLIITGNEDFDYTYLFNASDNASNYGGSWTDGSNQGNGFGPWVLSSGTNGGFAGHFIGDPTNAGITGMANPSFGLYANPDVGGNYANADRTFAGPLSIGSTFSVDWAVNWDSNGEGNKGINLYTGGTSGTQIININIGGSGTITIEGNPMFNNYGTNPMTLNFEYVSDGNLRVYGTGRDGSETYDQTIAVAGAPDAVRFYASSLASGDERQPYFNNLSIITNFSNVEANTDAIAVGNLTFDANLTLDNLLIESDNSVTIPASNTLTINSTLTNTAGTAALFLQSDATGTASLLHNTADVDMTIQRYLTGDANTANAKYHTVSVPLTAASDPQTGLFMGAYLYRFDFDIQNYVSMGTSTTTPLEVDEGYLLYYPNDNITYDFAGQANNGSFAAAVDYGVGNHYNLVPNPYPSAIDWDAASGWTKDNMNAAIYIYNTASSGTGNIVWASYVAGSGGAGTNGGTNIIPAGQAFFVQSNAAAPVLSMTNEVRVHNSQAFFKNTTEETETLRLFAHSGDFTDEIVVRYLPESSINFDGQYDALKFKNWNAAPNIYSLTSDKTELSINSIPYSAETYVMEVGFERGEAGEVVIEVQGMESFGDWVTIFLEDLLTGARIDLREQNTYSFTHEVENEPLRFNLQFMGVTGTDELSPENDFRIWSANSMLYLSHFADAPALMEVFDLQGRLLFSEKLDGNSSTSVGELPFDQVLIVRLSSEHSVTNQKVIIR